MSINKYITRIERMDTLIRRKATGTPTEFAKRMGISRSTLMESLRFMKTRGANLFYDRQKETYLYEDEQEFFCGYKEKNSYYLTHTTDQVSDIETLYQIKIAS